MASTEAKRLELHTILSQICANCYFEPPAGFKLKYPCIVYNRVNNVTNHADNKPYMMTTRYTVTVIDPDPDSKITPQLELLPLCGFDTHLETEGLSHDIFTIYH